MYAGDDYYAEFVAYAKNHSSPGHPPVSQEQFYQVCHHGNADWRL
jgi:uncharacterized short protein YbdD (DUF466 family)